MSEARKVITVGEMEAMSPQQRADAVDASIVRSWDEVPDSFRAKVMATARQLGEQLRQGD